MADQTPVVLQAYEAYLDGARYLGVVDVELPGLPSITVDTKGTGILGSIAMPVNGQFSSMTCKITFRMFPENAQDLMGAGAKNVEFWGNRQELDNASGAYVDKQHRMITRLLNKNTNLGKFEVAAQNNSDLEFEVIYVKSILDNAEQYELDKFNNKWTVGGVNQLAQSNANTGLS